jgi:hypothetical protein
VLGLPLNIKIIKDAKALSVRGENSRAKDLLVFFAGQKNLEGSS